MMKRLMLVALAAMIVGSSTGCCLIDRLFLVRRCYPLQEQGSCRAQCSNCGSAANACQCGWANGGVHGRLAGRAAARRQADAYADDHNQGAVAYPYYTNRGPRDFLAKNPRDIGP